VDDAGIPPIAQRAAAESGIDACVMLLIAKVDNVANRAILRLLWNELEADLFAKIANLAQAL
jgi:hypothetical protein